VTYVLFGNRRDFLLVFLTSLSRLGRVPPFFLVKNSCSKNQLALAAFHIISWNQIVNLNGDGLGTVIYHFSFAFHG